jgi:peptidoglycan hydrolase-like protein with peptidoglycan-binding domain
MRNTLRRIAFGVLATGMVTAMAMGATTTAASASVTAPSTVAAAQHFRLIWPVVRKGDHGLRVVKIELLLIQHGIRVKVDGKFGRETEAGVKYFQKKHHIFPSGIVGARTWEKLIVPLWKGSRGPAVAALQIELKFGYGFKHLKVDGAFGRKTELAVRIFQKRYHLRPSGIVGPSTWNALVRYEH